MIDLLFNASGAIWLTAGGIVVGACLLIDLVRGVFPPADDDYLDLHYMRVQSGEITDSGDDRG